jgi:hypothetical protein
MMSLTLVTGATAGTREAAIAARVDPQQRTAVILEGLPDGKEALLPSDAASNPHVVRIAPGCMHCTGNLILRVTLNRLLREKPQRMFVSVASDEHLPLLRQFLQNPPYDTMLSLTTDLTCT